MQKEGEHGGAFAYKTVNSDTIGWVIRRVTGKSAGENLSERVWRKLGMEQDAYFSVDSVGTEFAGGGLNTGLRDLARFGEMMRNDGQFAGQQIIPKAVVDDIRKGGDRAAFPASYVDPARLELPQHVVGHAQRTRRLCRARRARPGRSTSTRRPRW